MRKISFRTVYDKSTKESKMTLNGVYLGDACPSGLRVAGLRKNALYNMRLTQVYYGHETIRRAASKRREVKMVIILQSGFKENPWFRFAGFSMQLSNASRIFKGVDSQSLIAALRNEEGTYRKSFTFSVRLERVR